MTGVRGRALTMHLCNAGELSTTTQIDNQRHAAGRTAASRGRQDRRLPGSSSQHAAADELATTGLGHV